MAGGLRKRVKRTLRSVRHPTRPYDRITERLPPTLAGRLDVIARPSFRWPHGGPLNAQEGRQRMVRQIFRTIPIGAVVETGTFRGSSTRFFANHVASPVYTVESNPRYFAYARLRFRLDRSIHVFHGDSRAFLRSLAADPAFPGGGILFFYLDAHWGADLPLREELLLIAENWERTVILIDDFKVDDDPGYGYDDYGPDRRLCVEYIPRELWSSHVALYPAIRSEDETGRKRGCIVLLSETLRRSVAELSDLRAAPAAQVTD